MEKENTGFSKTYWKENYSEPETMDGIGNAKAHGDYLKSLFKLQRVKIRSLVDLGFGTGDLLKTFVKIFQPHKVVGVEPSDYIFGKAAKKLKNPYGSLKLYNTDLLDYLESTYKGEKVFDLGVCTSVFQYLEDSEISTALELLSKRVRYLYFTVPTDIELDRQVLDLEFKDRFALRRSQQDYYRLISPYFFVVSSRVLESRFHFNDETTFFTDLFFKF